MIMGQAAGVAAGIAVRTNIDVQNVDIPTLQRELLAEGAILERK